MLRHLFTLIWNKKKAHALLIVEIWASFLVLFGLATLIVFNVRNYRQPLGFTYGNTWAVSLENNQDTTDIAQKTQAIVDRLKGYREIESVSRISNNFPFSASQMSNGVEYKKRYAQVDMYVTDENFARTLNIALMAGRWYRAADSVGSKFKPVVINQKTADALFEGENPVGKVLGKEQKVVGVVENFKAKGEFMSNKPALFQLLNAREGWNKTILVRVKPGTDAAGEARMVKDITMMAKGWSVEVDYLTDLRQKQQNITLVPVIIASIVSGFLLINVALGLFGVLNLSIARRRSEIGLRRAIGATGGGVSAQFIGEIWVLATFALLIGWLVAVQFPMMNVFDLSAGIYVTAIGIATLIIYALVTVCALFPSRQAATIQPAVALHEE